MKLLKLILITGIILNTTSFAMPVKHKIQVSAYGPKPDTIIHKRKIKKHWTSAEISKVVKNHKEWYDDCAFTNKYTVSQRLKRYPFSKASKILAVSYQLGEIEPEAIFDTLGKPINSELIKSYDSLKTGLHIKNGILSTSSLKEIYKLNTQQINKLTNLIFNTTYRRLGFNGENHDACFNPRNALIFYDKNGKVFDYIEICFECMVAESPSEKITIGTDCNQKFDLLKKFFIDAGLKYGTINTK